MTVTRNGHADPTSSRRVPAGVVDKHADEAVDVFRRRVNKRWISGVGEIVESYSLPVGYRDESTRSHVDRGRQVDRF